METKHTPGPWIYGTHQDSAMVQTAEPCKTVATIYAKAPSEREANARLIAAAPDLLEALERIASATMSQYANAADMAADMKCIAAEAIAKATR